MILDIHNLTKKFGGVVAADSVSFGVAPQTITALIGPNGAGKSTVFNLISGTEAPDSGKILFNRHEIGALPPFRRARIGISRTFQTVRIPRNLTAREFLLVAATPDDEHFFRSVFVPKDRDREEELKAALSTVGLPTEILERRGTDLSYGQSKLLSLSAAILHPHTLLMLDEPVAGVNPVLRNQLKDILRDLRSRGETILLIEHDMDFVMSLADRVIVMEAGRVLAQGTPDEVRNDPRVLEAYLGEQL